MGTSWSDYVINQLSKKTLYRGFGYHLLSDIELPELMVSLELTIQPDIIIKKGNLTPLWAELNTGELFVFKDNRLMFCVPETAIFLIEEGNRIVVSSLEGADEDLIRQFLLGTCMGAILLQRKIFPLHGSAIAINGKAYAFVGESGAGKSTLASAFIQGGYRILSDDVIPLSFDREQKAHVIPSYPQQKLWENSLSEFGVDFKDFKPLYERETKYSVPVVSNFFNEDLPLEGIFELVISEEGHIEINMINRLEKLHTIFRHTFRNMFIEPLGLLDWHFKHSIKIINQLPIYQLKRPISYFTAQELVSLIVNTIKEECES